VRAATHLVELDYRPDDVAIAPQDYRVVESDGLGHRMAHNVRAGAVSGGALVAVVWAVRALGVSGLLQSVVPTVLLAAVAGAGIGLVTAVVQHRRARMSWRGSAHGELVPTSFDVIVAQEEQRANHDLAGWWDPAAPPARWRRSA
jgi:hypothetical protein